MNNGALRIMTAALGLTAALNGCSPIRSVSFMNSDLSFRPDPRDPAVMVYSNPNLKVSSYAKFLIEPVKIVSNESHIHPSDQKALEESFRETLMEALTGYALVTAPGDGVLRIRTVIQDIQPAHVELDEEKCIVLRLDTVLSRVAMELECTDALSNEPVAAVIHTLDDRKYFEKDQASRLLNVREAFHIWTRSLRQRLETSRMRPKQGFGETDIQEQKRLRFEEGE